MKNFKHNVCCLGFLFVLLCISQAILAGEATENAIVKANLYFEEHNYKAALPLMEIAHKENPNDPVLCMKLATCLYELRKDFPRAATLFSEAAKMKQVEAYLYLGDVSLKMYRIEEAERAYNEYLKWKKKDKQAPAIVAKRKENIDEIKKIVSKTEDIQIIDSLIVDKADLLSAYRLSPDGGKLENFNEVFDANKNIESTVYTNQRGSKIYFAQPEGGLYTLFKMNKLLEGYGNERHMSTDNFGFIQHVNYVFVMPDGVTTYFAAEDANGFGGYDLYVTRYNLNTNSYLKPQRLNMPFNSEYNDYLMVIDEQKGVGWFATDRFMPIGKVCVYTFIPNKEIERVESDSVQYLADRALITSIKDTWKKGTDYSSQIALAKKRIVLEKKKSHDFEFIINDQWTYYKYDDFRSDSARNMFARLQEKKHELENLQNKLTELRESYTKASANERQNMASHIIQFENKSELLGKEILEKEKEIRNEEVKSVIGQ